MRTLVASAVVSLALSACAAIEDTPAAVPASAGEPTASCAIFFSVDQDFAVVPALRVGRLGDGEEFALPPNGPGDAAFVRCARSDLMPWPSDYKVLAAGLPLVIASGDRVATLEISGARVNFRTLEGEFTDDEIPLIQAYLDRAQRLLDALGDED